MAMFWIQLLLGLSALYCGGAWLFVAVSFWRFRQGRTSRTYADLEEVRRAVELNTFHLGLCFILALGFLGVLIR